MYREHAGPPPPDPYEPARQNALNCGYMQLGMAATNVITLASLCLQLGPSRLPIQLGLDPSEVSAAKTSALVAAVLYVLVMAAWAGLNFVGLKKRLKVAYVSSIAFAIATVLSCFPLIFGVVLLLLLFKREMKGYFDARPAG
jgi:hypothetical protein